jgi:hypothetical protein
MDSLACSKHYIFENTEEVHKNYWKYTFLY